MAPRGLWTVEYPLHDRRGPREFNFEVRARPAISQRSSASIGPLLPVHVCGRVHHERAIKVSTSLCLRRLQF